MVSMGRGGGRRTHINTFDKNESWKNHKTRVTREAEEGLAEGLCLDSSSVPGPGDRPATPRKPDKQKRD